MLRRRLLTAAIAAPGLMLGGRAAASCGTPIIEGIGTSGAEAMSGSSVAPLGRVAQAPKAAPRRRLDPWNGKYPSPWAASGKKTATGDPSIQNCDGGGYTQPYLTQEQWWLAFYNAYSVYAGARPLPQGTVEVSSPDDSMARGLRDERGYLDHKDIAATLGILTTSATAGGFVLGGPRGAGAGAVWGLAATIGIIVIDTRTVYLSNQQRAANSQMISNPSELFYLNGQLSAYVPNTGVYTIPSILPPSGGGGGGFCIPTYLLL